MFDLTFETFKITEDAEYTCLRTGQRVRVRLADDPITGQEKVIVTKADGRGRPKVFSPAAFSCRYVPLEVESAGLAKMAEDSGVVPPKVAGIKTTGSGV